MEYLTMGGGVSRICWSDTYANERVCAGIEEGERGATDFVAVGAARAAWVGDQQAHRATLGGRAAVQCGIVLSSAIPAGGAGIYRRAMGGKDGAAEKAVLPGDG